MSYNGLRGLIKKGPKEYCEFSKAYYHRSEMNPDGNGGYIHKRFDTRIHNEEVNQSKFRKGLSGGKWQRGAEG